MHLRAKIVFYQLRVETVKNLYLQTMGKQSNNNYVGGKSFLFRS